MAATAAELADLASLEAAYRRALFAILGHAVFFVGCCVFAIVLRRFCKLPPALLTVAFAVALLLFGGDIMRFFACRRRLQRHRETVS